jgi:hypothetical protein
MKAAISGASRAGLTNAPLLLPLLSPGWRSLASKCALAAALPVTDIKTTCSGSQVSSVQERTCVACE